VLQHDIVLPAVTVQEKWDKTSDAEKPAAIAIILAVVVGQIAIGATMDAIDRIPLVNLGGHKCVKLPDRVGRLPKWASFGHPLDQP
jgi:hypothetical protein